ncbi:hypothetical protein F3202_24305, partial [Escherichia coli]|nr:hypothetical protein [Escherichia coli]
MISLSPPTICNSAVHGGVPPLVDEADEGRRRHRPGEQETLHRVATRLPQP